jgi:glycosyltransferase involved in cell wall biosynthesis
VRRVTKAQPTDIPPGDGRRLKRVDLHCHSEASTEASEALLLAINCPESYSTPGDVYAQAKRRGMDFVSLTDHDSIAGASALEARHADVLVGEELTCWFPEDRCKMHVLVWGLTAEHHDALQAVADDIYRVAAYLEANNLAHAVAHPVYRQNDKLERWHLERLMLLFKGFECANGAHSALHRASFEPMLDALTPESIADMSRRHGLSPRWPDPHVKSRTGGSDDHGLFNIGRTYTEFPPDVATTDDVLECLRTGRCRPAGEAGSSLKLAHNFFSVGIKYATRQLTPGGGALGMALSALVGGRPKLRTRDVIRLAAQRLAGKAKQLALKPFGREPAPAFGTAALVDAVLKSFGRRLGEHSAIGRAFAAGAAPLGEHEAAFSFLSDVSRDAAAGIAASVDRAVRSSNLAGAFDALGAVAAHQVMLAPYYFAFVHQNRERRDLARVTGFGRTVDATNLRVGLFTDTFDEVNGVARFVRDLATQASRQGRHLVVHTCCEQPASAEPFRKNFRPLLSRALPMYAGQPVVLPPLAEVMEWADRQQFDAIYVDTPGPMGLVGWLVARMLRVPVLGTWHTDFPAYVEAFTGDHRLGAATTAYCRWFYAQLAAVFCRTRQSQDAVAGSIGVGRDRLARAPAGVDDAVFNPRHRDPDVWHAYGVGEPNRLMYCGRLSVEKNLPLLVETFCQLCRRRDDVALVLAGDGPYRAEAERRLAGLPAYFLGFRNDAQLAPLYASSDLFVFPSRTDTLGQVIVEAQACGLPVLVSDAGGPAEVMDHNVTGLVIPQDTPDAWASAVDELLSDEPRRQRMARTAPQRMNRFALDKTFDAFWDEVLQRVLAQDGHTEPNSVTGIATATFTTPYPAAHPG